MSMHSHYTLRSLEVALAMTVCVVTPAFATDTNAVCPPITIDKLSVTNEKRGQELRVTFKDDSKFAPLLKADEKFNLFLCYVPEAQNGEVIELIRKTTFWQKFTTWSGVQGKPNGYPELPTVMYIGGNFDNPNVRSTLRGTLMILLGHLDLSNLLSIETLQQKKSVTIPLEPWVFGPNMELLGKGRIAAVLCKSTDHYLKQLVFLSNIIETDLTVPQKISTTPTSRPEEKAKPGERIRAKTTLPKPRAPLSERQRYLLRAERLPKDALVKFANATGTDATTAFLKMPGVDELWTTDDQFDQPAFKKWLAERKK